MTDHAFDFSDEARRLRAQIERNLGLASAARIRELFAEINPHLVGDARFESRWSNVRKDAAVLVPIVDRPEGATILFTVRSTKMPSHAGQVSFPGGKVAPGDATRIDTALREAEEEVNIPRHMVDVVGELGVHRGGLGFAVTPVVGVVDPAAPIKPCPREVEEIFEAPLSYFANLDNHRTDKLSHEGVDYNMFAAPYQDHYIWGLTAGILRSVADLLQEE